MGRENLQHLDANRGYEPARKVFSAEIERTQRNPSLCPPQLCAENLRFMESDGVRASFPPLHSSVRHCIPRTLSLLHRSRQCGIR